MGFDAAMPMETIHFEDMRLLHILKPHYQADRGCTRDVALLYRQQHQGASVVVTCPSRTQLRESRMKNVDGLVG